MADNTATRREFLAATVVAAGAAGVPGVVRSEKPLFAYVGTFSSPLKDVLPTQVDLPPGNGRGIHIFRVDRQTGGLTAAGTFDLGTSPSCLAVNAAADRLYSANETDRVGETKEGTVSAFSIDAATGALTLLNTVRSGGAGPTYVALHPTGRYLLTANYFGGSISVLPVLADGRLGEAVDVKQDEGSVGPTKATSVQPGSFAFSGHDRTHAHQILSDAAGRFVLHVDLGQDRIYVWKFDVASGKLSPADQPWVQLPAGDGPRHVHFHPNGRWLYSIQEEGSTIVLFDYDSGSGALTALQTVPSLPAGYAGSNFCSEILVSADGRFVYGGNRLHDSIGIFATASDGRLTQVGNEWTRGNYPRSFTFDPAGGFLYCCNQRADNVTIFRVNRVSGQLEFTGRYVPVGNPSIVVFCEPGGV
ncbi:MAG: lactonase family protein [Planctomycetaceae bacterium]